MTERILRTLVLLAMVLPANVVALEKWRSLPQESDLTFTVLFDGEEVTGRFAAFHVEWDMAANGPAGLLVSIDVTAATLFSQELNEGMAEPEWFDFARHPAASFRSTSITESSPGTFRIEGLLTLKGRTGPVSLTGQWTERGNRARLTGSGEVQRGRFDIGSGEWANDSAVGQAVRLDFDVTLAPAD